LEPLSEKRHRLHPHEIPEVIKGLILRLEKLTKERSDEEKARTTFLILNRLKFAGNKGRPKYPEFSWHNAEIFLERYGETP
jgi:hypothetical protein